MRPLSPSPYNAAAPKGPAFSFLNYLRFALLLLDYAEEGALKPRNDKIFQKVAVHKDLGRRGMRSAAGCALLAVVAWCCAGGGARAGTFHPNYVLPSASPGREPANREKTIIAYSGPTSLKDQPYLANFHFFLQHGLPSSRHGCHLNTEVVLVLTRTTLAHHSEVVARHNATCGEIQTIIREDRCYDMESAREAFSRRNFDFDKLVFLNCGLKGPFRPPQDSRFWTREFTDRIDSNVKLAGVTINCHGLLNVHHAHVQSMLWSTDRSGLSTILKAGAIYDCGDQPLTKNRREQLIVKYELGMSRAILESGHAIQDLTNQTYTLDTATSAKCQDLWNDPHLIDKYSPQTLVFWKVSRLSQKQVDLPLERKV